MASHKLAAVLRSTGRFSQEEIDHMSEDEAWQWLRTNTRVWHEADDESPGAAGTGTSRAPGPAFWDWRELAHRH